MTIKDLIRKTCYLDPGRDYNTEIIDGSLWVFFHASWSNQDWIRDFMCWPKKYAEFWFHNGYVKEFLDLRDQLFEDIFTFRKNNPFSPIIFAGYSRGSSVALIAKIVLKYYYNEHIILALTGLPRTVYSKDCYIDEDDEIIQYGKDLVTDLPPWIRKIKPKRILKSISKLPFRAIKDHGLYVTCEEEVWKVIRGW